MTQPSDRAERPPYKWVRPDDVPPVDIARISELMHTTDPLLKLPPRKEA